MLKMSRWTKVAVFSALLMLLGATAANAQKSKPLLETGDQAKEEIARGFHIHPNVGLLTFVFGDGALVYRPGLMMDIRIGGDITKELTVYGVVGGTVMGNTSCFKNPKQGPSCTAHRSAFQGQPSVPRQGVFVNFGAGARYQFLKLLDDRFMVHAMGELLGQIVLPDNAGDRVTLDAPRNTMAIGGGVGLGIGIEYFPFLKHFSVNADAKAYFFLTNFMPSGSSGGLAGMLGLALYASVGMKYTF